MEDRLDTILSYDDVNTGPKQKRNHKARQTKFTAIKDADLDEPEGHLTPMLKTDSFVEK